MLTPIYAGTSGFRGKTNKEITPRHALAIGKSFAELHREMRNGNENLSIAVGYDNRAGAPMLASAVTAGLESAGAQVVDLGMVSVGVFSTYMVSRKLHGGILVTGSHLPPDRIGIIPMHGDARYCGSEVTDRISSQMQCASRRNSAPAVCDLRPRELIAPHISNNLYRYHVLRELGQMAGKIQTQRFHVLFDPGNGTTGKAAASLLCALNCSMSVLNFEVKPFPDRDSECSAQSCAGAIAYMHRSDCDIGFCFDGDGDRILFIDGDGRVIPDLKIAVIFSRYLLNAGDTLVTPVNVSPCLEELTRSSGIAIIHSKIGQPATGEACVRSGQPVGLVYEANSGKFGFPSRIGLWYDGPTAGVMMLSIMAKTGKALAELAAECPDYFEEVRSGELPFAWKSAIVDAAFSEMRTRFSGRALQMYELDGLWFRLPDGEKIGLRASGTEPKWRVYAHARLRDRATALADQMAAIFGDAIARSVLI